MAKEYKRGEKYYLPVTISSIAPGYQYPIELMFADCDERDTTDTVRIADEPDLLLTATEIAENLLGRRCGECLPMYDELKSRNAELEALLKEVKATRDEAIKQNNELIAENGKLKAWYDEANKTAFEAAEANDELKAKIAELRDENEKLKAELDQRNKDFWAMKKDRDELDCIGGELRAQNEKLKAERDDLKSKVGKYTADIQDMAAEIHFHKEFGEGLDKQQKELQARYDELDSVNKEQAEKIRKLDKRNKYLESEKSRKPIVHVLTNDGHVYAFTSSGKVSVKYHTELNILMIEDGEKTIAGFSRGDKPGNLSAWWMG